MPKRSSTLDNSGMVGLEGKEIAMTIRGVTCAGCDGVDMAMSGNAMIIAVAVLQRKRNPMSASRRTSGPCRQRRS